MVEVSESETDQPLTPQPVKSDPVTCATPDVTPSEDPAVQTPSSTNGSETDATPLSTPAPEDSSPGESSPEQSPAPQMNGHAASECEESSPEKVIEISSFLPPPPYTTIFFESS